MWRFEARYQRLGDYVRSWMRLLNTLKVGVGVADLGSPYSLLTCMLDA